MSEELKDVQEPQEPIEQPTPDTVEEPENKPEEKMVPQSEIDRIVADRIARERKKFSDYEDLKAKTAEYETKLEEQRLAELSEKERAEELAKKAEEERNEYATELDKLRTTIRQEKIDNAFIKAATAHNIAYIDDALRLADLSAVEIGEDGKPVGVDDVVKALVENKPFLIAQQKPAYVGESTNPGDIKRADKTADQVLQEAADKARKSGRIEDRIAYDKLKRELHK